MPDCRERGTRGALSHLSQRSRRGRPPALRCRDPGGRRGWPARPGGRRDGHRAPGSPRTGSLVPRSFQRPSWLCRSDRARRRKGGRRLRGQLSAGTPLGDGTPQPVRSADRGPRRDCRGDGDHRDAYRGDDGARRTAPRPSRFPGSRPSRARGTAYWNVRLLHALFDLSEVRVHSAGRRAARRSPAGSARIWASRSSSPTTGNRACGGRTSSWRRLASSGPNRCCAPSGSPPARWSFRTGR